MLADRSVRGRVTLIALLVVILLAVLGGVLISSREPEHPPFPAMLAEFLEPRLLPGSPQEDLSAQGWEPPLIGDLATLRNAEAPFVAAGPAARPFIFTGAPEDRRRARTCLAAAMLYEAGNDGAGQLAVAQVVLNRVRHPAFPHSVCGVVTQGSDRATGCQFTFTCDGALARRPDPPGQAAAIARAEAMLNGFVFGRVGLATHYHTVDVYPWWSPRLEKITRVGPHLFFRWPGYWGSRSVVLTRQADGEPPATLFAHLALYTKLDEGEQAMVAVGTRSNAADARGAMPQLEAALVGSQSSESKSMALVESSVAIPAARRLGHVAAGSEPFRALVIDEHALGGSRLLRMFPEEGVFYLEVAPGSSETARRHAAELLCGGRPACRVYGWRNGELAPLQSRLSAAAEAALAFTFIRAPATNKRAGPPSTDAL